MRKIIILLSLLIPICLSLCNTKKQQFFFDECLIDLITTENHNFPSQFSRYLFFVREKTIKLYYYMLESFVKYIIIIFPIWIIKHSYPKR
jgi:hypothetical protein